MRCYRWKKDKLKMYSLAGEPVTRNLNPNGFNLPVGYSMEAYAAGLDCPIGMTFGGNGEIYIADSGINSGISKVLRLREGRFEVIAQDFMMPITGISYMDGNVYVSHKGFISAIRSDGTRRDVIAGLPSNGDFGISNVAFGPDGKMYFAIGTFTNSGVVGPDNSWAMLHPMMHDNPAVDTMLIGQNYETDNIFIDASERIQTGAFAPYGESNFPDLVVKGCLKCSGCLHRAERDGTGLELVAWGFRNPVHIGFDHNFRLFAANRGYDVRGSRPIANAPDEFHQVLQGIWYGWPDYAGGEPVTLPKFRPEGRRQPEFIFAEHPNQPPRPFAIFPPHTSITGFDFNYHENYGYLGDAFIAEFGTWGPTTLGETPYDGIGQRISRINMINGEISTFINNKSGLPAIVSGVGGFGRPVDVKFGPDGAMYVLDSGLSYPHNLSRVYPFTGVIWRITRSYDHNSNR